MAQLILPVIACLSAVAGGQEAPPGPTSTANTSAEVADQAGAKTDPREGLWPSPRLMELMLQRWVEAACEEYDLDSQQREVVREEVVGRWSQFLTDNRDEIQPLVNEFIEMRMDLSPPEGPRVKKWAEQAAPVFEKTRDQIHQSHDGFRKVLRPAQRAKFEVDALKMNAGMAVAEQKLKQWSRGEVDKDVFWEPLPADRQARREERRRRREEREAPETAQTAEPAQTDQIAIELDRWDKYVADFIVLFRLDEGQKASALSCLSELKHRALSHRDRRREDIAQLEQRIASFTGDESDLGELKKRLAELYGPIDEMFKELRSRLDGIPTTEQRAAAPQPPAGPSPEPEDKPPSASPLPD